jgi:beta-N-acetylhexosaminidase
MEASKPEGRAAIAPEPRAWAGAVLVAGFPGPEAPAAIAEAIESGRLGGIVLFRRNIDTPIEAGRLIDDLVRRAPADHPLLVAIDQEGGRVARLGAPVLRLPPMRRLAALGDPDLCRAAGRALGRQLRALGITMDFAPVLDVDSNPDNPVIGDRSFGRDPETVVRLALPFAEGLHEAGVASCGKHFPGHGDTDLDSHLALPRVAHDRARLDAVELAPFRDVAGALPAIMTAHVIYDALDPGVPATLSRRTVTGLLKEELGYGGAVISDDLEMKAVSERWGVVDAGLRAIEAGCDALLVCSDVAALGTLRDALERRAETDAAFAERLADAAARTLALRRAFPPAPIDGRAVDALEAALHDPEVAALEARLAHCLETRS